MEHKYIYTLIAFTIVAVITIVILHLWTFKRPITLQFDLLIDLIFVLTP